MFDSNAQSPFIEYVSAGTGKSFLLRLLYNSFLVDGLMPVKLASTGVAAHTIDGRTLHRVKSIQFIALLFFPSLVTYKKAILLNVTHNQAIFS